MCLLHKPPFFRACENFSKAHGHFRGDAALAVHEFGKRVPRDAEGFGGLRDGHARRLDAFVQYNNAGVRRIFHRHDSSVAVGKSRTFH